MGWSPDQRVALSPFFTTAPTFGGQVYLKFELFFGCKKVEENKEGLAATRRTPRKIRQGRVES